MGGVYLRAAHWEREWVASAVQRPSELLIGVGRFWPLSILIWIKLGKTARDWLGFRESIHFNCCLFPVFLSQNGFDWIELGYMRELGILLLRQTNAN